MVPDKTPLQKLSKKVFNAEHRLSVCLVLLGADNLLTAEEVASASRVNGSSTHKELLLLTELGLLQRVPGGREYGYQRVDSPFWGWTQLLIDSCTPHRRRAAR